MPYANSYTLRESLRPILYEETSPPPNPGPEDLYGEWGFTVYRTAYGLSTDTSWNALIQTIRVNLQATISHYYENRDYPTPKDEKEAGKLLLDLFRLDVREGLNLKDKSLDDLRDSYHKEPFSWKKVYDPSDPIKSYDQPTPDVFFVADAQVLKAVETGTYIFKCVDADWYHRNYKPHPRVPQRYWGWMPMTPLALLPLWQQINDGGFVLENVAPSAHSEDTIPTWCDPDSTFGWGAKPTILPKSD